MNASTFVESEITLRSRITIVTGLWNLTNDKKLKSLQECDYNICIYVDPSDEDFVWRYRSKHNTKLLFKRLVDFESWFEFYPKIQSLQSLQSIHYDSNWNT